MTRRLGLAVFLLVLVLRVAVAAQFRGNFDSDSYRIVAEAVLAGQNVYASTSRYNYSPFWSYVVAGLWALAGADAARFVLSLGLFQIAVDAATAGLIARLARDRMGFDPEAARRAALLFFANPVSVLISCAHGQFDGLSILCLCGALFAAMGPERGRRRGVVTFLSLSLLVKHITAFHPLLFWRRVRPGGLSAPLLALPFAVFALSFLPFLSSSRSIAGNVLLYGAWLSGKYAWRAGVIQSVLVFPGDTVGYPVILAAAVAAAVWLGRRLELPRACLLLFLALLVFQPGFASQYFVWPMALGSLYPSPGYALCATAAALFESGSEQSLALPWPVAVTRAGAWVAALLWLAAESRRALGRGRAEPSNGAARPPASTAALAPSRALSASPTAPE